jgi:predicted pyridoxine 5'-phosphate oxidase superfamily flavin-nucleotide-binding protein
MRLSEEMKRFVLEQRLGYHATVNPDGTPNLSHKGTTSVYDDEHLFFADIRSPQTVANLRANPAIEVNVVDIFARRGYRFKGTATIHEQDETYRRGLELLRERDYTGFEDRVRSIVLIRVQSAEQMTSPAYDIGQTESELVDHYIDYYVGLHRQADSATTGTCDTARDST